MLPNIRSHQNSLSYIGDETRTRRELTILRERVLFEHVQHSDAKCIHRGNMWPTGNQFVRHEKSSKNEPRNHLTDTTIECFNPLHTVLAVVLYLLHAGSSRGIFFDPEDGGGMFLRNVG
jgi:hypothetical protein